MAYSEALADRVLAIIDNLQPFEEKKMFGGVGYLVGGNMACGVNKADLIVRVGLDAYEEALRRKGAHEFDITGRPMRGWVAVSEEGYQTDSDLRVWVEQGVAYAASLPPK